MVDANTRLVSIMHVNNETGAINDIEMLVKAVKTKNPNTLFMSDGVQAVGKIKVNLRQLGVDFYTFSGHKIHAPKGVGGLFVKKGIHLNPLIYGGGQENGLRSGTENVASIEALSLAVKRSTQRIEQNTAQYLNFKDIILSECQTQLGSCVKQISPSDPDQCSPNILTLSFSGVKSQVLLNILEQSGYIIGLGSACNSHNKTNRVMSNIGLDRDYVDGVVRICFSKLQQSEEVSDFARIMCENVKMLREL